VSARRRRLCAVAAAAVASAAFLWWPSDAAQVASAAAGRVTAGTSTAQQAQPAATPACDPTASFQPPTGPPTVTPGSYMETIRARGYLIAGVDLTDYHLEYLNPSDGQVEGFDIDMLHAISTAIFGNPNQIHYVGTTDNQREPFVESGQVDIVAHTMTMTCDRWKRVDFSTVYLEAHQQILVADGSRIQGVKDLKRHRVCATEASTSLGYLQKHGAIPVKEYDWSDCLVRLQQGQVAAISTDNVILAGLKAQDPYTKIVGPYLTDEPYGLAISQKHKDFVEFVNAVLAQMRANGQWAASYDRWLGGPAPAPPAATYQS
jgi:polar amino acid transport system substrate-binding protein